MSKRRYGGGTIDRGPVLWRLRYYDGAGKRCTTAFRGQKKDAAAELRRLVGSVDDGSHIDATKETLASFLDRWERDWASINVSPKTFERYVELLRHVRLHLGTKPIQKLRPVDLSAMYARLLREGRGEGRGLAARTVGHVHRALHGALAQAVTWDLVKQNVAASVRPPKVETEEVEILTAEEIIAVLQKLHGQELYPIVVVLLGTGMRRSEALALRWRDVDLNAGKLRVEQAIEQTKAGLRFKSPKTKYGRRTISLPASAVTELRAHRKVQQEQRLALGQGKLPDDALVFGTWDGAVQDPRGLSKKWERTMADFPKRITLHALRHTHASQLIAGGKDILTVSRRLGHGSPEITLRVYSHLFSNKDASAAETAEQMFAGMISADWKA